MDVCTKFHDIQPKVVINVHSKLQMSAPHGGIWSQDESKCTPHTLSLFGPQGIKSNQNIFFLEPDVTVFEWEGGAGEDVLMDLATLLSQGSDDLMLHGLFYSKCVLGLLNEPHAVLEKTLN